MYVSMKQTTSDVGREANGSSVINAVTILHIVFIVHLLDFRQHIGTHNSYFRNLPKSKCALLVFTAGTAYAKLPQTTQSFMFAEVLLSGLLSGMSSIFLNSAFA